MSGYYLLTGYVVFGPDIVGCISGADTPLNWQRQEAIRRQRHEIGDPSLASGYQVIPVRR